MLEPTAKKFRYAFTGLKIAWQEETSFKVQVTCALLAVLLGAAVGLSVLEFVAVIFAISFVLTAEAFNTALEELCDKFQPTEDPHIAKIKDLAAAAVLLSSLGALVIGLIIFIPHFI